ncbi:MAG: hypothetical protein WD844_05040 [Thermoleophilaceae bacterium]
MRRRLPVSAAARRRTRLLGAFAGSSVVILFGAEAVRVWRLGTLPLTRGDTDSLVRRRWTPRQVFRVLREGYRMSATRENAIFTMAGSFVLTFGITRGITYSIRTRGGLGPIRDIRTRSGRHIHHFLPGMVLAMLAGGTAIASSGEEPKRWLALPFGTGIALVLDEAALLLELEDVYWSEEGVLSVHAAFAALGLLAALAYASRVVRAGRPSLEVDWETAARAFDHLQMLPGHER